MLFLSEPNRVNNNSSSKKSLVQGLYSAVPIGLGYIPVAITFAIISQARGIPDYIIVLMSVLVFAGASQFAAVGMWSAGSSVGEIVLATFVLNLRHLLFSASLSRRLEPGLPNPWAALLAFGLTDETFATSTLQPDQILPRHYILGLNFLAWASWVGGTVVGLMLSGYLPQIVKNSLGIALYALFIGLLAPAVRGFKPGLVVLSLAVTAGALLYWTPGLNVIPPGWRVIIATILAAGTGAMLYPKEEEKS